MVMFSHIYRVETHKGSCNLSSVDFAGVVVGMVEVGCESSGIGVECADHHITMFRAYHFLKS